MKIIQHQEQPTTKVCIRNERKKKKKYRHTAVMKARKQKFLNKYIQMFIHNAINDLEKVV